MADFIFPFVLSMLLPPYLIMMRYILGGFDSTETKEEISDAEARSYILKVVLGLIGFILYGLFLQYVGGWIYDCIGWKMTQPHRLPTYKVLYSMTPLGIFGMIMGGLSSYWLMMYVINRIEDKIFMNKFNAELKDNHQEK